MGRLNRETMGRSLDPVPGRAPYRLESLARICLRADRDDCRLGDLSEQYVRNHEQARARLGGVPGAMAASHLAAGVRYLLATANVMFFARAVEPGLHAAENGVAAFVALDLRERTMTMLRFAVVKFGLPALLLMCSAVLLNSAVDVWRTWRQTEALMAGMQREKAEVAVLRIDSFMGDIERQVGWVTGAQWARLPVEQRRFDYVRLLRQTPAITALTQLDGEGREQLAVSRLAMDVVGSGTDRSADPAFVGAKVNGPRPFYGPLHFRKASEPYVTMAIAHGGQSGVTIAEVNLKAVWDAIRTIQVGETGYAYVVDGKGRLIADRDIALVLKQPDLSALPQVADALARPNSGEPIEGKVPAGTEVVAVHAAVPRLGWQVFVELPAAEGRASLWSAVIRGAGLLALGLATALLAIRMARRPLVPAQPART